MKEQSKNKGPGLVTGQESNLPCLKSLGSRGKPLFAFISFHYSRILADPFGCSHLS